MTARWRNFALMIHVVASVGFLGAVVGFLAMAVAGLSSRDAALVRAVYPSMDLITVTVIVPLCLAALATGVVSSLGTPWGLVRHYWVVAKLLLTVLTTLVLLVQLKPIRYVANAAARATWSPADLLGMRSSFVLHASAGLVVLLVMTALSTYKPKGLTRHGWRKQQALRAT